MRFRHLVLVMILAACNQDPNAGTAGHTCRSWPAGSLCDEGLRCMNDTCTPCGTQVGMMCCDEIGHEHCLNGLACVGGNQGFDGETGTCEGDCGSIGLACCGDGTCPTSGDCENDMCEGDVEDMCQSGGTTHTVYVLGPDCYGVPFTFHTDTPEQAEECRQELVAAAVAGEEVCPLDMEPEKTPACSYHPINGYSQLYLPNCSAAQLAICEQFFCSVDCTWTEGDCPQ